MNRFRTIAFGVLVFTCVWFLVCIAAVSTQGLSEAKSNWEEKAEAEQEKLIGKLNLSEDSTAQLTVRELRISGNTLIPTTELLKRMPLVYNTSDKPLEQAESSDLYDFSVLHDIVLQPGRPRQVSTRTIQGFTQYVLSVYQDRNYAGVYVYVPAEAISGERELRDGLLPIEVLEAAVSNVRITQYGVDGNEVEQGYLRRSVVEEWSPVKIGQVVNKKKLDDFINLLNLNPDRYVSVTVSKGTEPKSLALGYDIYEKNPWHYYIQVDNSGTKDRQWTPRVGLINTNLTGIDDSLTLMGQVSVDKSPESNYSIFGSYEFPLRTPKLRLNLYGGHSEFDIEGAGDIDFLGNGSFYGAMLRFNVFQRSGWFFDAIGSLSHEHSQITPSLLPEFPGSDIDMDLLGIGFDIHRSDDISDTSIVFNRIESIGGSSRAAFEEERTGADPDFTIYITSIAHSQLLDTDKIQRLSGNFQYINSNERLVPAKMTTFGGMYTVRGYEENAIVADGGILASIQYEFDLVARNKSMEHSETSSNQIGSKKRRFRKLAPLVFFDYGRANVKDALPDEDKSQGLYSVGPGIIAEVGEHFNAGIYYGYPLKSAEGTKAGDGRVNISFMLRW